MFQFCILLVQNYKCELYAYRYRKVRLLSANIKSPSVRPDVRLRFMRLVEQLWRRCVRVLAGFVLALLMQTYTSCGVLNVLMSDFIQIYILSYPCNWLWRHTGLWEVETPTFSLDIRLTDRGEVSLTHRPPFIPGRFLVLISVRRRVDPSSLLARSSVQLKKQKTTLGIEPVAIRL
jgi:hypothetical protein